VLKKLCDKPRGLILVTGPTGSGKSTTLAAMIDYINENKAEHIVTIEDPIEFLHRNKKSLIRQRELGADTNSFAAALKHVLRQDPDVIMVGEMRDLETIALAVTAAETGHLVFATVHTIGAPATIDRVVDVFPPYQQQQIRMQLSIILEGVISQVLIPRVDGTGRACALEIMAGTLGVRNIIREGKTHQLMNIIQSGAQHGMQTLDASLKHLYQQGIISYQDAISKASNPDEFIRMTDQESGNAERNRHVALKV
jgi:twitching motility protein PilT